MKQLIFVLVWILFGQTFSEDKKLLFVQIIFRHGDRAPIELYPNDPNPPTAWPEGLGALTALGKKQQFALGKYFRKRYSNFATSSPLEVNVISSDKDRCLMSAETNLASFYAPDSNWSFDSNLPWQPISIRYLPQKMDKYLEVNSYCPRAYEERRKVIQSPEGQRFLKEHEEMYKKLSALSGYTIADWTKANYFHGCILVEKIYNLTVPTWVEPYWDELSNVSDLSFFWNNNSPLLHRLRAGPLIGKIIEMMNQKINNEIPKLKFQIYSGHDTNIAVVLVALNLFNMKPPPYCSSLMFELYEMPDSGKAVRMLYQNSSNPEVKIYPPQVLILEGCTEFCPLDYFIKYTKHLILEDWDLECQLDKSFVEKVEETKVSIGWFLVLIVVVAVISVFLLWRLYFRRQDKKGISAVKYGSLDDS